MEVKRKYHRAPVDGLNQMRMQQIGCLLREYRFNTYLSRDDFAHEYGISRSLVERIENGKNITLNSLLRICDIFQLRPQEIFEVVE